MMIGAAITLRIAMYRVPLISSLAMEGHSMRYNNSSQLSAQFCIKKKGYLGDHMI